MSFSVRRTAIVVTILLAAVAFFALAAATSGPGAGRADGGTIPASPAPTVTPTGTDGAIWD